MKQTAIPALFVILMSIFVSVAWCQEDTAAPARENESNRQLRIFREALLQGSSEDIRVEAAVELLLRNEPASQEILITALKAADNAPARQAVCKALIKSRGLGQSLGSRETFLNPLLEYLTTALNDQAVIPAEALLLFDFSQIEPRLNDILQNDQATQQARINAVYALQIRPEPQALRGLIGLLDDADAEVSKAAEKALQESFGIPIGTNRNVWSDILDELKQKSPDDIRRERLLRQEMKLRQVQAERDRWQKLYLAALDRQYDTADEPTRAKMTLEMLGSDLAAIRLWALGRVAQYQAADKDALRERLFALLGDESRDVRLQTAKVLNNMSALNPAQKLLERFKLETDPEVALAMFEALGEACFFAFSPGSEIELSPAIKEETMNIAVQYLDRDQPETVRKAAEIIRKMLELNNLSAEAVQYYLNVIYERYQRSIEQSPVLRADLLSVMAHLCGQGLSRQQAGKLYEEAFVQGLTVTDNSALRLAAVRGLLQIDVERAFALAKKNQLMADESPAVRLLVVEMAGNVGGADDLEWLVKLMNGNGQSDQAWQAIRNIARRQKSPFLLEWLPILAQVDPSGEAVREILDLAEQKAVAEKAPESLKKAREQIIQWYAARKAWETAAAYLDGIGYPAQTGSFDAPVNAVLLDVYLFTGQVDKLLQVVRQELSTRDFAESSPVYVKLNGYLHDETVTDDVKRSIVEGLAGIQVENRPHWQEFIDSWVPVPDPADTSEVAAQPQPAKPAKTE